jgi:4a-hydroxytetrahydrobiopterin dehydratase
MSKLSENQVTFYLGKLPNWKFENNCLIRTVQLKHFKDSIHFVQAVADLAEQANHHPDILIQYDRVTLTLTSHDEQGVSGKDLSLAEQIDTLQ